MSRPDRLPELDAPAIERERCPECGSVHATTNEYRFRYLMADWTGWLDGRRADESDGHAIYLFARHRKDRVTGRLQLSIIPVDPWNVIGPVDGHPDAP